MVSGRCEDQKENSFEKKTQNYYYQIFHNHSIFLSDILSLFWFNQITGNSLYGEQTPCL